MMKKENFTMLSRMKCLLLNLMRVNIIVVLEAVTAKVTFEGF